MLKSDVEVGDKVHYQPSHYDDDKWLNGVVKTIPEHTSSSVHVVYHCNNDWENYQEYTAPLTDCRDLKKGWRKK